jgi:hypothetical protein
VTYPLIVLPFVASPSRDSRDAAPPAFGRRMGASGISAAVLVALTALFDTVMIAAGLFQLPARAPERLRVGLAPVEEFSYAVCAAFLVPAVFALLPAPPAHRGAGMTEAPTLRPATVARELLIASRPVSWINTAVSVRGRLPADDRQVDLTLVIGTLFFLVPYNLAMYGVNDVFDYESDLRNPRKGGAHGAVLDRRMHRITLWARRCRACRSSSTWSSSVARVMARPGGEPLLRGVLQRSPAAAEGGAVRGLVTSSIHFFSPAVYGSSWRARLDVAAGRRDPRLRAVGRRVARVRRGAGRRRGPRRGHLSIATARAPAGRVVLARCYAAAGAVMLATPWPDLSRRSSRCRTGDRVAVPARHGRDRERATDGMAPVPVGEPARRLRRDPAADLVRGPDRRDGARGTASPSAIERLDRGVRRSSASANAVRSPP